MRKPVACSLEHGAAHDQLVEWSRALVASVGTRRRPDAHTLELDLLPGADLSALVALARREVTCCPFFGFSIRIEADKSIFVATVPPDAAPILDGFAALGMP